MGLSGNKNRLSMLQEEYDMRREEITFLEQRKKDLSKNLKSDQRTDYSIACNDSAIDSTNTELNRIDQKIAQLRLEMQNSCIVTEPIKNTKVAVGTKVDVIISDEEGNEEEKSIYIGGYNTPIEEFISVNAPIVEGILGLKQGESKDVVVGGQIKEVEVQKIELIPISKKINLIK